MQSGRQNRTSLQRNYTLKKNISWITVIRLNRGQKEVVYK